ncbi:MAG TPA: ABC transporter permease subunit [Polyangiaceae bacterium]|nr:ABC transporter permease subunit [Polyangiaceae bacterium]
MGGRILAIALNTYREAARARLIVAMLVLAIAWNAYSVVVAAMSLHNEVRVVADLGAASMSLFGVVVAIVLGSTSLHRELQLKTVFPILSRPIRRWEYVVGKYLGMLLTVLVFVGIDAGSVFATLGLEAGQLPWRVGAAVLLMAAMLAALLVRARHARVFVLVPWALAFALAMWLEAGPAAEDRQLVTAGAALTVSEVAIVAAVAMLFASFSSPGLTATFTTLLFVIGRSADTLAHLPRKLFGPMADWGKILARVVPNLHVYVPARPLLLGQLPDEPTWTYVSVAALHAALYATGLLAASALIFRKRDFA